MNELDIKPQLPDRISHRIQYHDYSGGDYFVTICTHDKKHYFGKITNNRIYLSKIGKYCEEQMESIPKHYPYASIPVYVVMPNHIHAIICIDRRCDESLIPQRRKLLGVIIGGVKRAVTLYAKQNNIVFGWQARFHDHIIRGNSDGNNIADYIETNVARWSNDCYFTD